MYYSILKKNQARNIYDFQKSTYQQIEQTLTPNHSK